MARSELEKVNGKRMRFTAKVERFGKARAFRGPDLITLLLTDVRFEDGSLATDHLWFKSGVWSEDLQPGLRFAFDARVDSYDAGYRGAKAERLGMDSYRTDYHLERPTNVEVLEMDEPFHKALDRLNVAKGAWKAGPKNPPEIPRAQADCR